MLSRNLNTARESLHKTNSTGNGTESGRQRGTGNVVGFTVVYFKAPLGVCSGNSSVTYDNNLVIILFILLRDPFGSSRFDYMITWNGTPLKNIAKHLCSAIC